MSIMTMLIAFLITFGVALVFALLIAFTSPQESRHRTKSQLLREMLVPPSVPPYMRSPDGYRSARIGNLGLGEWLNEEIEQGKQAHRPQGSRIRHTKSYHH
jgi:hypothetical protein